MRGLGRLLVAGVLVALALGAGATPAAAHGVGGVRPTNYETRIESVRPAVAGVTVEVVDLGDRLELENRTGRDVTVLGYEDEPYLRVGPRGVFENARSPSTYVNRTREGTRPVPARADAEAAPEWRKIGDEPIARWHDHRAHWMSERDAPAVRRAPGEQHVIQRFAIEVLDGDRTITVRGDVRWIPGPSPWGWVALAAAAAIGLVVLARTRLATSALEVALVVVIVVQAVHVVGAWGATTLGVGTRLGASVYAAGSVLVAAVTLVWLVRRGLHAAAPLLLITGLFVAITGGLTDLTELTRSQLLTTWPAWLARLCVALALGLGVGLAVVGGLRLRGTPEERRRRYLARRGTPRASGTTTPETSTTEAIPR